MELGKCGRSSRRKKGINEPHTREETHGQTELDAQAFSVTPSLILITVFPYLTILAQTHFTSCFCFLFAVLLTLMGSILTTICIKPDSPANLCVSACILNRTVLLACTDAFYPHPSVNNLFYPSRPLKTTSRKLSFDPLIGNPVSAVRFCRTSPYLYHEQL